MTRAVGALKNTKKKNKCNLYLDFRESRPLQINLFLWHINHIQGYFMPKVMLRELRTFYIPIYRIWQHISCTFLLKISFKILLQLIYHT